MKKFRVLRRSVLSLTLCLSLVISPMAGTGIEAFAEEGLVVDLPPDETSNPGGAEVSAENVGTGDDIADTPVEEGASVNGIGPSEEGVPTDGPAPSEGTAPTDEAAPSEGTAPTEGIVPTDGPVPSEGTVPTDGPVPSEGTVPADGTVPSEGTVPSNEPTSDANATTDGAAPIDNGEGIPAAQADENGVTVYVSENFDSDTYIADETIIQSGAMTETKPTPVLKGLIQYHAGCAGNRTPQGYFKTKADGNNKYLEVQNGDMVSVGRGVYFTFEYAENMTPEISTLKTTGELLELNMKFTSGANFAGFVVASELDPEKQGDAKELVTVPSTEGQERIVRVIIDAANGKKYMVITENGSLVSSSWAECDLVSGKGIAGATFFSNTKPAQYLKLDDINVVSKPADVGLLTVSVTDGTNGLEGAKVVIDALEQTTDADGNAVFALPYGDYTVKISKEGYQTSDGQTEASESVTFNASSSSKSVSLSAASYTAQPKEVTIEGGQSFIAASKEDTPAQSAGFSVSVKDQMGVAMAGGDYELAWNILPQGKAEADPNVTIDANGQVFVAKDFYTNDKAAAFEVTATATANGESAVGKAVIVVTNSNVIYYKSLDVVMAGADRGTTIALDSGIALPDTANIVLDVEYKVAPKTQLTVALLTDGGRLTGVQYQTASKSVKAWTGWKGNTALNQWNDVDMFDNGEIIAENVDNSSLKVNFTIDKASHTITVASGENTVLLPYDDAFKVNKLNSIQWGKHEKDGESVIHSILIEEVLPAPEITGAAAITKKAGQTVEETYTVTGVEGESFTWAVKAKANGGSTSGITITNGKLSVADSAAAGEYIITIPQGLRNLRWRLSAQLLPMPRVFLFWRPQGMLQPLIPTQLSPKPQVRLSQAIRLPLPMPMESW